MRVPRRVLVGGVIAAAVLLPALYGARMLDRMALAYTTGLRRSPDGPGYMGVEARKDGPPPGIIFLGRSSPDRENGGFVMRRVSAEGREAGLEEGDRVVAVDGKPHDTMGSALRALVRDREAGDVVPLDVVRDGEPARVDVRLVRFVRHPGDLGLPFEEVEFDSGSGFRIRGWWIPPPKRATVGRWSGSTGPFLAVPGARPRRGVLPRPRLRAVHL